MSFEPLLTTFLELRKQGLALGIEEYAVARKALAAGFGTPSREELIFMCQTVWAKNQNEQHAVAEALSRTLPSRWQASADLNKSTQLEELPIESAVSSDEGELLQELEESVREAVLVSDAEIPDPATDVSDLRPLPARNEPEAGQRETPLANQLSAKSAAILSRRPTRPSLGGTGNLREQFAGAKSLRALRLEPEFPVSRRHMDRAWRYYRRMRRAGSAVAVDVDATIEQVHRHGVFIGPVMVPIRRNLARLLLLVDTSSSMLPFMHTIVPLLASASEAGLVRVESFFFNDVPGPVVFRDKVHLDPFELNEVTAPFTTAGILIVSDAGSARGTTDMGRVNATATQLGRLRAVTTNVAWLNPMPPTRWSGSTAGEIARLISMFPFSRVGLDRAVDILRGRRAH